MAATTANASIQIRRAGLTIDATDEQVAGMRANYEQRHSVVLRGLIAPPLLAAVRQRLDAATFEARTNRAVGQELRLENDPAATALAFLTNDPALFRVVRRITGCPEIGCFRGRVYRLMPQPGHESDWHPDLSYGRMLTMSINLSPAPFEGGVLQIRLVDSGEVVSEVANTGPGDAVLFRIDPRLEHRVTPTTGRVPRTAYAGWFHFEPSFSDRLRSIVHAK